VPSRPMSLRTRRLWPGSVRISEPMAASNNRTAPSSVSVASRIR
jgi:hypothetical protein